MTHHSPRRTSPPDQAAPKVGTLFVGTMARDRSRDAVGRVMGHEFGRVWLRPPGGGREWVAQREDVEPLTVSEALLPHVAEVNRHSPLGGRGTVEIDEGLSRPVLGCVCLACGARSGAADNGRPEVENWAREHAEQHSGHRIFRVTVESFWRLTTEPQRRLPWPA